MSKLQALADAVAALQAEEQIVLSFMDEQAAKLADAIASLKAAQDALTAAGGDDDAALQAVVDSLNTVTADLKAKANPEAAQTTDATTAGGDSTAA